MATYQRVALFLAFDAIERDLITLIRRANVPESNVLSDMEREKASNNLRRRTRDNLYNLSDDLDLLHGLDLGDKWQIAMRLRQHLSGEHAFYIQKLNPSFEKSIPIRNDTMHGRPLTVDDYAYGFSFINELIRTDKTTWHELSTAFTKFSSNPTAFSSNSIYYIEEEIASSTLNNLPPVDYDDTGFVPRPQLEAELKKKILGRHPVITVQGDGGNGKSALALQTAYRLVDSSDHDFEAVIWVSAKSSALTTNEIIRIEGAITDSLGIFESIANVLEPGDSEPIKRVEKLLTENRVLLFIDNLETVIDDRIREFAENLPGQSKLVFTSRVPLGSDLTVVVGEFNDSESLVFLRRLIAAYNIKLLRSTSTIILKKYLSRLNNKPLLIKWFALGVLSGLNPDSIVRDPKIALDFCLDNVVSSLSENAKNVAVAFATLSDAHSAVTIQYVTQLSPVESERALVELRRYSFIEESKTNPHERAYVMRMFPRAYLRRIAVSRRDVSEQILTRYSKLERELEREKATTRQNPYDPRRYTVRSKSEAVVAGTLGHAVATARRGEYVQAAEIIEAARILSPEYFEIYRASAFIAVMAGDVIGASDLYETALEIDSTQPQLFYWFGGFLMRYRDDHEGAATQFEKAKQLDPDSSLVLRELARSKLITGNFDDAQALIEEAANLKIRTFRDDIIFADLEAQIHIRKSEYLLRIGDFAGCEAALEQLQDFVLGIDSSMIDRIFVEHLSHTVRTCNTLISTSPKPVKKAEQYLDWISYWLSRPIRLSSPDNSDAGSIETPKYEGYLKESGRQPSFGFLVYENGEEAFLHRSSVTSEIWAMLIRGERVRFNVAVDHTGKKRAASVQLK